MKKLIYGVGINDAEYPISRYELNPEGKRVRVWTCPFYDKWTSVLERTNCDKLKAIHPTYKDCKVCEDWLIFSNFKNWMETQFWKGLCLDKDILVEGNKIYSPEFCAFVPTWLNTLLNQNSKRRGDLPLGVNFNKNSTVNKYRAQVSCFYTNKNKHLGLFPSVEEAHKAWKLGKAEQILLALDEYTKLECYREDIYISLFNRAQNLFNE